MSNTTQQPPLNHAFIWKFVWINTQIYCLLPRSCFLPSAAEIHRMDKQLHQSFHHKNKLGRAEEDEVSLRRGGGDKATSAASFTRCALHTRAITLDLLVRLIGLFWKTFKSPCTRVITTDDAADELVLTATSLTRGAARRRLPRAPPPNTPTLNYNL